MVFLAGDINWNFFTQSNINQGNMSQLEFRFFSTKLYYMTFDLPKKVNISIYDNPSFTLGITLIALQKLCIAMVL